MNSPAREVTLNVKEAEIQDGNLSVENVAVLRSFIGKAHGDDLPDVEPQQLFTTVSAAVKTHLSPSLEWNADQESTSTVGSAVFTVHLHKE